MSDSKSDEDFVVGKLYYRVSYYDKEFRYPDIETVIYLGEGSSLKKEIDGESGLLYFQDAESYAKHGRLNCRGDELDGDEIIVRAIEVRDARLSIHDLDEMVRKLKRAS